MRRNLWWTMCLAAGSLALAVASAEAKIAASAVNANAMGFGTTLVDVVLTTAGGKSISFTLGAAQKIAITYAAECSFNAAGSVQIDVVVDGKAIKPSAGTDNIFCSSASVTPIQMTSSTTVAASLAKGSHIVKVRAQVVSGSSSYLDDSSLVIFY